MSPTPAIAIHLTTALAALLLGPAIFWGRRGIVHGVRPSLASQRWHRAAGHAWFTLMLLTALSALFIRSDNLPNWHGYSAIHLLVPFTLAGLGLALLAIYRGNVAAHRRAMLGVYFGACVGAGVFTLLPGRYLGNLVWHAWLGWL